MTDVDTDDVAENDVDAPLTLSQLKAKRPKFKDVLTDYGTFRGHRLEPEDATEMSGVTAELVDDNDEIDKMQIRNVLSVFVAQSLGGEYKSEDGKDEIRSLPMHILMQLINTLSEISGMGVSTKEVDAAKND